MRRGYGRSGSDRGGSGGYSRWVWATGSIGRREHGGGGVDQGGGMGGSDNIQTGGVGGEVLNESWGEAGAVIAGPAHVDLERGHN